MRRVDVAEVGFVVGCHGKARIDVGLIRILPGGLVPLAGQAVLIVIVNAPDLVHAERRVGESTVDNAVGPVGDVDAVGSEAVLIGSPYRGLIYGSINLEVSLLVPVGKCTTVAALLLQEHLMQTEE